MSNLTFQWLEDEILVPPLSEAHWGAFLLALRQLQTYDDEGQISWGLSFEIDGELHFATVEKCKLSTAEAALKISKSSSGDSQRTGSFTSACSICLRRCVFSYQECEHATNLLLGRPHGQSTRTEHACDAREDTLLVFAAVRDIATGTALALNHLRLQEAEDGSPWAHYAVGLLAHCEPLQPVGTG